MAKMSKAFDSKGKDDMNSGFDPIPKGTYVAKITESEIKDNSKGTGKLMKLKFEVMKGEFKGRLVWVNLNIVHVNPVCVDIAEKELATICRACGKPVIQDTNQLHGIPIKLTVKIKPAKGDYPPGNEPTGYTSASVSATSGKEEAEKFVEETKPVDEAGELVDDELAEDSINGSDSPDDDIPWGNSDDDIPF